QVRLIDYDGMYVPHLYGKKALELGRSEFQHPNRTQYDFDPEMDRFSFWVMITALEALKYDHSLWKEVMQGGFNTLDNFLFSIEDFRNPRSSGLFQRLRGMQHSSLQYFVEKLQIFCGGDIKNINRVQLQNYSGVEIGIELQKEPIRQNSRSIVQDSFEIVCKTGSATVLSSTFQKLGTTPLELRKDKFSGKVVIITNGTETKKY